MTKATEVSPWVGIRSDAVEARLVDLLSLPPGSIGGSLMANIGYILGIGFRSYWPAGPDEMMAPINAATDLVEPHCSLEGIRLGWLRFPETTADPVTGYRRVVVSLLLADRAALVNDLAAAEAEYCSRDDEICATFRSFAAKVRTQAA